MLSTRIFVPAAALAGALIWGCSALAAAETPSASAPGRHEVLEAPPVSRFQAFSTPAPTAEPSAPAPTPVPEAVPDAAAEAASVPYDFARPRLLLPYYLTAYVPSPDRSELNLGLVLSQSPGIEVGLGWGALTTLELLARVSALGASNTVALGAKFPLLFEEAESNKPALTLLVQTLYVNHRTLGDVRENIFRGNRLQAGAIVSKDLGLLGRNLGAAGALREVLTALRLHGEALVEYQTGREGVLEGEVSRFDAGAKLSLEATLQPEVLYAYAVFDTIPDWLGETNYFVGARYYSQADLAFDALAGRLQNNLGLVLAIAWIF